MHPEVEVTFVEAPAFSAPVGQAVDFVAAVVAVAVVVAAPAAAAAAVDIVQVVLER